MSSKLSNFLEEGLENNPYINRMSKRKDEEDIDKKEADPEDFISSTLSDLDDFDNNAWNKGDGYISKNFSNITENLEGLDEGLFLVAGESNTGKSAFMLNVVYDFSINEDNKLFGIYYCLDDSKSEIIPRVIAMNKKIPIGVAAKPQRYQNMIDRGEEGAYVYEEYLEKRQEGLDELKQQSHCFKIEDSERLKTAEDVYNHMKQLQAYVRSIDKDMNIIVAIDAVDDLRFSSRSFASTTDRHAEIARTIKSWATELHIPIFGSRHLSKLRQNRRPTLDDLKDSNEYVYEASVVWIIHNDVSKNKQAAQVYYQTEGSQEKFPVLEIDWAKNKKSSFKGRTYAYFIPNYSKATECGENESKRYDTIVYSS